MRARGHVHRNEPHLLECSKADELLEKQFEICKGDPLFHSVIVHFENEVPNQVEDRWVNPIMAPD